jgi:hypothetical protein
MYIIHSIEYVLLWDGMDDDDAMFAKLLLPFLKAASMGVVHSGGGRQAPGRVGDGQAVDPVIQFLGWIYGELSTNRASAGLLYSVKSH